jgi:hypothetical protein
VSPLDFVFTLRKSSIDVLCENVGIVGIDGNFPVLQLYICVAAASEAISVNPTKALFLQFAILLRNCCFFINVSSITTLEWLLALLYRFIIIMLGILLWDVMPSKHSNWL